MLHQKLFLNSGIFVLLCAFVLNVTAWGIQTFNTLTEPTVADAAISMSKIIGTCPHHPHGSPKDCLCPKIYVTLGGAKEKVPEASGVIREPTLVTCTEHGEESLTPTFSVFLPESFMPFSALEMTSILAGSKKISLCNPLQEPPQKIPIV